MNCTIIRNTCLALSLGFSAQAAEPAGDTAAMRAEFAIPDWPTTMTAFERSPYYKIWTILKDSALGPDIAKAMQELQQESREELGFDVLDLIKDFQKGAFQLSGEFDDDKPQLIAEMMFNQMSDNVWIKMIAASPTKAVEADGTLKLEDDVSAVKDGNAIRFFHKLTDHSILATSYEAAMDHHSYFNASMQVDKIEEDEPEAKAFKTWLQNKGVTTLNYFGHGDLGDFGIKSTVTIQGFPNTVSTPIDANLINSFTDKTIAILAFSINGPGILALQDEITAVAPEFAIELEELDANLQMFGIPNRQALFENLNGTLAIGITPGLMIPGLSANIPANDAIDTLLNIAAMQAGADLSTARQSAVVVNFPNMQQPVYVFRSADSWVLSTDPAMVDPLAKKTPRGFDQGAIGQAAGKALMEQHGLFCIDTQALAQMVQQYLPMAQMFAPNMGPQIMGAQAIIPQIIPHLKPSILMAKQDENGIVIESRNDITTMLMPAMVLSAIGTQQRALRDL